MVKKVNTKRQFGKKFNFDDNLVKKPNLKRQLGKKNNIKRHLDQKILKFPTNYSQMLNLVCFLYF